MKNLTNILSYLWLLLLMAVTACSDLEEEVGPMHVEEEVELNIQLHVPDMQASTREEMVITENISSIVAIAFDESGALIKKVDAILSGQGHVSLSGTLKIKVPKRTQTIHFLGNYTKNDIEKSITSLETLNNFTTTDDTTKPTMRYWGMTTFDGSNINQPVTLYRNMAKLTLTKGKNINGSCYIAGFVNRNISGTIVPSGHAVGDTPTIPDNVGKGSYEKDNSLGNVYYLFEHANVKNNSPLYVIIEVAAKYYKVAFAAGDTYFPILRNRAYEITVTEPLDEMYAEADYLAAVESQYPINDLVITSVPITDIDSPTEVLNESGQTFTVTITIPEDIGITELNVPTHDDFTITPPDGLTEQNGKYTVTPGNSYEFTLTVKGGVTAGNKTISFSGRGKYLKATGSASIELYDNVQLTVAADPATIYNTAGSTRNVTVTVPQGITTLTIPDATTDAFIVTPQNGLSANNDGSYTVSAGDYLFTLQLRTDGDVGLTKTVTFNGSGQYKRATGSTTLTLEQAPAQEILSEYELWVENSAWKGSTNYDTFFTWNGDISAGDASNLESTFYDDGANAHKSRHMVMGQNNSISFTIPDTRYLTLLVASNNGNTPSINLTGTLTDDGTWATATSEDDVVPDYYNFGKGEIGTAGRLIRYKLEPGTYTLQGSNTSYLLYYLRVSTEKPTMTDIVQPTVSDYSLSWSGNNGGYLKDPNNDAKYFVDEEATNFIPTLTYNGLSEVGLSTTSLQVVTNVWTFVNEDDSSQGSMQQDTRNYTEANISSLAYNEGAYTLSGSVTGISGTSYKYATFYDNLQLKSVSFNVKNTVKVALYNSWDSDAQPVTEFVEGGDNILGFKMPQHTLPVNPSEKINFTIDNSWQLNQSGAGIYQVEGSNYQIGDQANQNQQEGIHYHPRTEWTYKISWNNISNTITPTSTTDDVYFSYNGVISKNPTITTTQGAETPLSITLDFYQTEGENLGNNATYNLKAGSTPFYLKATIYSDDAVKYSGRTVLLNGTFSSSKGYGKDKNGIHWDYSEIDTPKDGYGKIACNSDGTQLQFTIDPNETDYLIEWVFVPGGQYSGDDINFTYQISGATVDSNACTLNNESQTTLNVDVLDIALDFDYPATFDGSPAPLDNMVFGVSNFYLRATISQADATAFAGSQVLLAGAFSGGGNYAVSWYDSRVNEGTINYDDSYNGTGLLFTIDANQQNYFIHWCFERYNYGEDPASFTYTISKPENANYRFFRVSGETETSLTLKNSAEIFSGTYQFNTGNDWGKFYSISETFPVGTKITVGFGEGQKDGGCTVKFCDAASQNALKIPSFTGVNYGPDNNLYFSFTGSRIFDVYVNETTELYINGDGSGNGNSGTPNGNLSNKPLEGFKIEGTDAILQSITVTAPESALRNAQDNNNE